MGHKLYFLKGDILRYAYGRQDQKIIVLLLKALSHLGFWAVLNYRVGKSLRDKFKNGKIVWVITGISKLLIEILTGVSIPYECQIGEGLLIGHFSGIMIAERAVIGRNCTLHQNVTIGLAGRGSNKGVPFIGDNVFIGAGAVVLGNVVIGNNVGIGANAVITKNICNNAVVVGHDHTIVSYKGSRDL